MAGRACRENEHRIFFAHRIGLLYLAEQFCGIGELGGELVSNLLPYLVTATVNAGANRGFKIARPAAEVAAHLAHSLLAVPVERSPPACVKYADGAALRVDKDDRETIGGLDSQ